MRKWRWSAQCWMGFVAGFFAAILLAQGQPPAGTCKIAPPALQSFSIERTAMSSDIKTTYSTSLSSSILASLASGQMEMRERLILNTQTNSLTSTVFLVQAGSPIPTPVSVNIGPTTLAAYTISVDRTYTSCSPFPSVMLTGTITSSSGGPSAPNGIYNLTFTGAPAAVSIGYTTDNPPMINNVVSVFAGVVASFSANASGTLTFLGNAVPGQPTISSVVNSASMLPAISPNSWVTIMGSALSSTTDTWDKSIVNGVLPTKLDGVSVMIGNNPAYVSYISPGQINVVAPVTSSGPVTVMVTNSSGTSAAFTVMSGQYNPAFFSWPGSQAVATHLDFSEAVKPGTFSGINTTPAKPGETIILWCTGLGPTTPAAPTGSLVPSGQTTYGTSTLPSVTLNNAPVTVVGAALTPGAVGLYQVDVQIPSSISDGDYQIQLSIGGVTSPLGIILSVQQ